ncbi:MAG TPA: gliding motility-associated ABC transporter substrate-binding protein GldG, partial [Flavobacteriales bacterium]|nr:gliding motility-associated ABC transporter substrate-binding protein GldG [Flavobacteriales bacterium]
MKKARSTRSRDLTDLLIGIGCILLVLFIGSFTRVRADLTAEKRYTLTPATRVLVDSLSDVVFVKVYLGGELPADMRQLQQATRDLLDEMRQRNPQKLQYEFIDPSESPDEKTRRGVYEQLEKDGLQYSSIRTRGKGEQSELIVWPCAMLTYQGKNLPVQLLRVQFGNADPETVNRSINNLEYEFTSGIRQVTAADRPRVAFLEGHGELDALAVQDIANALTEQYDVSRVRIDGRIDALSMKLEGMNYRANKFEALVVAKPDSAFSDKDLFIIDQFILNGGRVLWAVDAMDPHLDSLRIRQFSIATPYELNLDASLFAYGARINKDLVLDKQCAPIQVQTTPYGGQPKSEMLGFPFEPIIIPRGSHPIVNNLDPLHLKMASTIDTIGTDSTRATVLLTTSPYTWVMKNPVRISLGVVDHPPPFERTTTPERKVAVLVEGRFHSAFADRLVVADSSLKELGYREWGTRSAQVFVSDGDAIENYVDRAKGLFAPLGYDRYAQGKVYGNREFFVNVMNYLLDDNSLISIRTRAITLRQLDTQRIETQ